MKKKNRGIFCLCDPSPTGAESRCRNRQCRQCGSYSGTKEKPKATGALTFAGILGGASTAMTKETPRRQSSPSSKEFGPARRRYQAAVAPLGEKTREQPDRKKTNLGEKEKKKARAQEGLAKGPGTHQRGHRLAVAFHTGARIQRSET